MKTPEPEGPGVSSRQSIRDARSVREALTCGKSGCQCARPRGAVHCPAHADSNPSLSVNEGKDGKLLLKCFAGCSQGAVIAALQERGLWPKQGKRAHARPLVTRYEIKNLKGELVAIHERKDYPYGREKGMRWLLPDGTPSQGQIVRAVLPLYGTEELAGVPPGAEVVVTEGEKAADALNRRGILAVGTVTGASGIPNGDVLAVLLPFHVNLWSDNDGDGQAHMARIASVLTDLGHRDVWIVDWAEAPDKGDAADFVGDDAALRDLLASAHPLPSYIAGTPPAAISTPDRGEIVPARLADVESTFREWLLMPDMGALRFVLAMVAGHRLSGDPLVKQLAGLSVGHALIRNRLEVGDADFAFVRKVALDCLPQLRLRVIEGLRADGDFLATGKVAEAVHYPTTTARRHLEDLAALGIVEASKGGPGHADKWQLREEARNLLDIVQAVSAEPESDMHEATFPAMSGGRDNGQQPDSADPLPDACVCGSAGDHYDPLTGEWWCQWHGPGTNPTRRVGASP